MNSPAVDAIEQAVSAHRAERRVILRGGRSEGIGQPDALRRRLGHFEHSKARARQRYGLNLTTEVEAELVRRAASGQPHLSRFLGRYSVSGDTYEVYYARTWYRISIDVLRGCIMTFLPPLRACDQVGGVLRARIPKTPEGGAQELDAFD